MGIIIFIKRLLEIAKNLFVGLMFGMKGTEEQAFTQKGQSSDDAPSASQEMEAARVSKALLKGEITQAVEELRYRTYLVGREASEFEYFSPTLAVRRGKLRDSGDRQYSRFVEYAKIEGKELVTIQDNWKSSKEISKVISEIEETGKSADWDKPVEFAISIERSFTPRYRMEEFAKRIAVFKDEDCHALFDLYFSKYPADTQLKTKGFIREVERIKDNGTRSDILKMDRLSFETLHAYQKPDMLRYSFKDVAFREAFEYDGNYVLRFWAVMENDGLDLAEKYYSKTMDEKYGKKEQKELPPLDVSGMLPTASFVCERCGKEVLYDPDAMGEMPVMEPRYADDEQEEITNGTEYFDYQIAEATYGRRLCKECLAEYIKEYETEERKK